MSARINYLRSKVLQQRLLVACRLDPSKQLRSAPHSWACPKGTRNFLIVTSMAFRT
jgi:hypothetical protein